jgi:hypothetical protein
MEKDKNDQNKFVELAVKQNLLIWKITDSFQNILNQIEVNTSKEFPR